MLERLAPNLCSLVAYVVVPMLYGIDSCTAPGVCCWTIFSNVWSGAGIACSCAGASVQM